LHRYSGYAVSRCFLWVREQLNTANLLKEAQGQWRDDESEGWARRFFENGKVSLKWQSLKPYEKFAEMMIERHWDGIAVYWKVPLKQDSSHTTPSIPLRD